METQAVRRIGSFAPIACCGGPATFGLAAGGGDIALQQSGARNARRRTARGSCQCLSFVSLVAAAARTSCGRVVGKWNAASYFHDTSLRGSAHWRVLDIARRSARPRPGVAAAAALAECYDDRANARPCPRMRRAPIGMQHNTAVAAQLRMTLPVNTIAPFATATSATPSSRYCSQSTNT